MPELIRQGRSPSPIIIGVLLILLGSSLFLDRLDLVNFRWASIAWIVLVALGAYVASDGFKRKRRGRLFCGSGLFFFSFFVVLTKLGLIERESFYLFPVFMIALGLSFLALFVREPKEFVLLIPSLLFIGVGGTAILLWWDFLDWYDLRWAIRTFWPLAFVAWGGFLLAKKKTA